MAYEIEGKILCILDTVNFASGFTKREFVIETEDKYPQQIKLQVVKDKCAELDGFSKGEPVKVSFDIRGNEYKGKYYVDLHAWRIGSLKPTGQKARHQNPAPQSAAPRPRVDDDDEIPF